jgi:predicted permease
MPRAGELLHELSFRLRALVRRGDVDRELRDEIVFHQEMLARDLEQHGTPPAEAARAARVRFGNPTVLRERSADWWGFPALESVMFDVRFGARLLARSPAFALVAIVAIGLAIGVNAGFFTLVDAFVFQPMPVRNPDRLVKLLMIDGRGGSSIRFSYSDLGTLRRARSLEDVVAFDAEPVAFRVSAARRGSAAASLGCISGNYFSALGGTAVAGRTLTPQDEASAAPVVAISEAVWQRDFARSPAAIGRDVVIDGVHATIVGVISSKFIGINPLVPELWMTLPAAARIGATPGNLRDPSNRFFSVRARLRSGITSRHAEAELSGLLAEPAAPAGSEASLTRVAGVRTMNNSSLIEPSLQVLLLVAPGLFLVALVLVIACANLANLLLSRALARQREIAIRLAIGASRGRLLRQLLTESTLIALGGAALGLLMARWTVTVTSKAFFSAIPTTLGSVALALHPSWRVVAYIVVLVGLSVVSFGLAPALFATSPNVSASLKGEDAAFGTRIRRSRFRDWLIALQVAACLILLAAAGTLVTSLKHVASSDSGIDAQHVLVSSLGLAARDHVSPELVRARTEYAHRVAALHDVASTARAAQQPFAPWPWLHVRTADNGSATRALWYNVVTPSYLAVVGQRIVSGRSFSAADSAANAPVAIVTDRAARALWPGQRAVGQTLRVTTGGDAPDKLYQVVGIAADAHSGMVWDADDGGYAFLSATSDDLATGTMPLLVRPRADPIALTRAMGDIAQQVAQDAPVNTTRLSDAMASQLLPFQYGAGVSAGVGALGLGLAILGLYGIVSFGVRQRRRDLAVHIAMGATPRDVVEVVLRREMQLVVVGLAVGLVGAAVISKLLGTIVLTVEPMSVADFAVLTVVLFVVALLAAAVPAASALRIAPMQVLRQE